MLNRILNYIYRKTLFKLLQHYKKRSYISEFDNPGVTIIASNCMAGCIYSDLKQPFNSPTINCFFYSESFTKFSLNLNHYLQIELKEVKMSKDVGIVEYPVGCLDDVEIHFLHYKTFEDAKIKWDQRKNRVNYNNIVFMMTDRDINNESDLGDFLKGNNYPRIVFTVEDNKDDDRYIYCYKEKGPSISPDFTSFRKYDKYIDVVKWLNSAK
jgi:uncharacterized protein (DUF1919 family)